MSLTIPHGFYLVVSQSSADHALIVFEDGAFIVNSRRHETLSAFLQSVSKWAQHGLRFRRATNSLKYVLVEDGRPGQRGRVDIGQKGGGGLGTKVKAIPSSVYDSNLALEILGLFGDLEGIARLPGFMGRRSEEGGEEVSSEEQGEVEEGPGLLAADQEDGRQVLLETAQQTKRMLLESLGEDRLAVGGPVARLNFDSPPDLVEAIRMLEARITGLMKMSVMMGVPHEATLIRSLTAWRAYLQTIRMGLI